MVGLYDAKPFTTYWYYPNVYQNRCDKCNQVKHYHLMRYRVYMGIRYPIIPTGTNYYLVCSGCGKFERIESKEKALAFKDHCTASKPFKYHKYSQLDLDGYIEDEVMVFGTDKELGRNIELHLRDMMV